MNILVCLSERAWLFAEGRWQCPLPTDNPARAANSAANGTINGLDAAAAIVAAWPRAEPFWVLLADTGYQKPNGQSIVLSPGHKARFETWRAEQRMFYVQVVEDVCVLPAYLVRAPFGTMLRRNRKTLFGGLAESAIAANIERVDAPDIAEVLTPRLARIAKHRPRARPYRPRLWWRGAPFRGLRFWWTPFAALGLFWLAVWLWPKPAAPPAQTIMRPARTPMAYWPKLEQLLPALAPEMVLESMSLGDNAIVLTGTWQAAPGDLIAQQEAWRAYVETLATLPFILDVRIVKNPFEGFVEATRPFEIRLELRD